MKRILSTLGPTFLSGILLFLAFPAMHLDFLAWFALVPLLLQSKHRTPGLTAAHFFVVGWIFHTLALQWLATNIFWAGGWALIGYQLMCLALSVYWALAGFIWKWITERNARIGTVIPLVLIWGTMETLQSILFTGFGWSAIAHSQTTNPMLLQWASLGGFVLIGMLVIAVNALIVELFVQAAKRLQTSAIIVAILAVVHGLGYAMLGTPTFDESPLRVGIVQPSTPLQMKWDQQYKVPLMEDAALKSRLLAQTAEVDLFVWPEAQVMSDITSPAIASTLSSLVNDTQADLFTGAQRTDGIRHFNSSYFIQPNGNFNTFYDKMHLAPYGEYVPFSEQIPFLGRIVPSMSDQTPGDTHKVFESHDRTLGPLICFEVLFSPMAYALRQDGADVLIVITNLGWFGHSNAATQELAIAKLRAVETRLPVIHASNSGISGVIDAYGNLTMLNRHIDHNGIMYNVRDDLTPSETINQRLVGAIAVPQPAKHPLPQAPHYFPWLVCAAFLIMIGIALFGKSQAPDNATKGS
ncbi:MAG: apolipoprotein N-acyltransferase [Candidatus Hydrogenedentota bacterium]